MGSNFPKTGFNFGNAHRISLQKETRWSSKARAPAAPMAAIYLTVQFDIKGKTTSSGKVLSTSEDITEFILNEAKMAVVPFSAFGAAKDSTWYRLSVGTCKTENIPVMMTALKNALSSLK
jgi:aspartate aminotransferase